MHNVQCDAAVLSLDLEASGKPVTYYTNDYLKIDYYNINFSPKGSLNPCTDIEGMKATIHYTIVPDAVTYDKAANTPLGGQIIKLALTKLP